MMHRGLLFCVFLAVLTTISGQSQIAVSISTDKRTYILGEPVVATTTIVYKGEKPILVNNPLEKGPFSKSIEIIDPSNRVYRFVTNEEYNEARRDRIGSFRAYS